MQYKRNLEKKTRKTTENASKSANRVVESVKEVAIDANSKTGVNLINFSKLT